MAGKKDKIKDVDRFSIITKDITKCYICGLSPTHKHEVFGGSNRAKSKEDGMVIGLCAAHHNMSDVGIHFNKSLDKKIKQQAEKVWLATYTKEIESEEEKIAAFIKRYGKNYL